MRQELTHKEFLGQLMYNPWTGYFYWKSPRGKSNRKYGDIAGGKNAKGYIQITINYRNYTGHRLAWFYVYGYMPENLIDHKDRIKYHNWIKNLREVTNQCNIRNTGNYKTNTSGVKGVSWAKEVGKWRAGITIDQKSYSLGYFDDFDEAVCTRLACEQACGWAGCDNNSLAYLYVKENIQCAR